MLRDRYPDANVLAQRGHWDEATRRVVMDRVHNAPPFRYFDDVERPTLEALCARIVPQEHRMPHRRVPIAPWIDARCAQRAEQGFRYDDMPANAVAWKRGLQGLDQTALALHRATFAALGGAEQDDVLRAVRAGNPPGRVWRELPAARWWIHVAVQQIAGTYYAHPYAWDEIGFGGPAYPRGYAALNDGAPEPWEAPERTP